MLYSQFYSQHYTQSHLHTDVHLALGWSSSIIALAASAYAWKAGFQASRQYTLYAVITFVILSTVLTFWQKYVEKDTVFQGARKIHASSRVGHLLCPTSCRVLTFLHLPFSCPVLFPRRLLHRFLNVSLSASTRLSDLVIPFPVSPTDRKTITACPLQLLAL